MESRRVCKRWSAREAKESTVGSVDLLVARIGQRTNDIMKVLTLVTVILLPVDGARRDNGHELQGRPLRPGLAVWVVVAAMVGIALLVLFVARSQRWI